MADNAVRATLAGILLFVIGLAIGGGALENYRRERERLRGWQQAAGEVVQLFQVSGGSRPVIAFTAAGGDRIRFTAAGPLATGRYKVGDPVRVVYPAADPSAARLDSPATRWARTVFAGAGAAVLIVLGGYVAWYAGRRDAERPSAIE